MKEAPFIFDEDYKGIWGFEGNFDIHTHHSAPDTPFEIMCDASNYVVGAVLGQRIDKLPHVIYYAIRTLNDVQLNYSTLKRSCWQSYLLWISFDPTY
jgi:hypothetical protein